MIWVPGPWSFLPKWHLAGSQVFHWLLPCSDLQGTYPTGDGIKPQRWPRQLLLGDVDGAWLCDLLCPLVAGRSPGGRLVVGTAGVGAMGQELALLAPQLPFLAFYVLLKVYLLGRRTECVSFSSLLL